MGVVMRLSSGGCRAYFKSTSEILAKQSTPHIVVHQNAKCPTDVQTLPIDELAMENISRNIIFYLLRRPESLKIALLITISCRDLPSWPPVGMSFNAQGEVF